MLKGFLKIKIVYFLVLATLLSCGDKTFLNDFVSEYIYFESGDILVLSGGTALRTATPFPLHQIVAYNKDGVYKGLVHYAPSASTIMGMALMPDYSKLLFTMDTFDQVMEFDFSTQSTNIYHTDSTNLTGTTMRTVAVLSDNSIVVAESTTSIEKFDSSKVRVTAGFPLVLTANLMKLRRISGGRFVALFTGGDDRPRIYTNAGVLSTQVGGLACANNCDPSDILELSDGRFIISYQGTFNSLELFDSSFTHLGRVYQDTSILNTPSAIAQHADGDILACSTAFNTCEKFRLSGTTGTRVGTTAFLNNASQIRQPTDIVVLP